MNPPLSFGPRSRCLFGIFLALAAATASAAAVSPQALRPPNDNFTGRIVLAGPQVETSASNAAATQETGEPDDILRISGASLWWSWTAPVTGRARFATHGSSFDTLLALYTGGTLANLSLHAINDEDPELGDGSSLVDTLVVQGTTYHIVVAGRREGTLVPTGTIKLSVSANVPPSVALSTPKDGAKYPAGPAITLCAEATDADGSVRSVDFLDGENLLGTVLSATAATTEFCFTWTNAPIGVHSIRARAVDDLGRMEITAASEILIELTNDRFEDRHLLVPRANTLFSTDGSNVGATKQPGEPNHSSDENEGGKSVWWSWRPATAGRAVIRLIGDDQFNGMVAVYTNSVVDRLVAVARHLPAGSGAAKEISFDVTAGATYQIAADGYRNGAGSVWEGTFTLQIALSAPPTVTLNLPAANSSFKVLSNIPIRATATDPDSAGLRVEVYANEQLLFTDSSRPYSNTWVNVPEGSYRITAVAIDDVGVMSTSAPVAITVVANPGDKVWEFAMAGNTSSYSPAIDAAGNVYLAAGTNLYSLKPDGELNWRFSHEYLAAPTVTIGRDGTVYAGSHAIDSQGAMKWFASADAVGSALGADETQYVVSWGEKLIALNPDGTPKWEFATGFVNGSSPAVAEDGTIHFGSWDNHHYALYPDGSLRWKFPAEAHPESGTAIGPDGTAYFATDSRVFAVDRDGNKVWEFLREGPTFFVRHSTPAIGGDGTVYVGHLTGLVALNPTDGALKWTAPMGLVNSSPAIGADGTIYVGSDDGKMRAIAPDGKQLWEFDAGSPFGAASPILGRNGLLYFGTATGNKFFAVKASQGPSGTPWPMRQRDLNGRASQQVASGEVLWEFNMPGYVSVAPAVGVDGTVYVANEQNAYALHPDGIKKWEVPIREAAQHAPVLGADGTLYIAGADGLHALNPDGTRRWISRPNTPVASAPAIGYSGDIYVGFGDGAFSRLNPETGEARWTYRSSAPAVLAPILSQYDLIFFGTSDHQLISLNSDGSERFKYDGIEDFSFSGLQHAIGVDGTVYVTSARGTFMGISWNGDLRWEFKPEFGAFCSPAVAADGTIYLSGLHQLFALDHERGTLVQEWSIPLFRSTPAIASDGTLYISLDDTDEIRTVTRNSPESKTFYRGTKGYRFHSPMLARRGQQGVIYISEYDGKKLTAIKADHGPADGGWPMYRRNLSHTGSANIVPGDKLWSVPTGVHLQSTPAIGGDGTLYFGSLDARLFSVRPNGETNWIFSSDGEIHSSPVIGNDGTIHFISELYPPAGTLFALAPDGTERWKLPLAGRTGLATPSLASDGTLYVGGSDAKLLAISPGGVIKWSLPVNSPITTSSTIALDGTIYFGTEASRLYAVRPNGTIKWHFDGTQPFYSSSPVIGADGTIYIGGASSALYAIDPDGRLKWEFHTGYVVYASPVIGADGTIYVASIDQNLYALAPDGKLKWQTPATISYATPLLTRDGSIIVAGDYLQGFSSAGKLEWRVAIGRSTLGSPILAPDGTIYVPTEEAGLVAIHGGESPALTGWPMFQRNARHTGNIDLVAGEQRWAYQQESSIISSPAIGFEGQIYVGTASGKLLCLTPQGGRIWERETGDSILSSPAIASDGTIYVGSNDGNLHAFSPDGTNKWAFPLGASASYASPALGQDNIIYMGSAAGSLVAITSNGAKVWELSGLGISSYAVGADDHIYAGSSTTNRLYSFRPDGTMLWEFKTEAPIIGGIAIGGDGTIYVGALSRSLYAINPDGTQKWAFKTGYWIGWSPAIGADGTIYVASDDGSFYAIRPDGTLKWKYRSQAAFSGAPVIGSDGLIYIGDGTYSMFAFSPDGRKQWEFPTGGVLYSSPTIGSDGSLYFGSGDGNLYALEASPSLADSPWPMISRDPQHSGNAAIGADRPTVQLTSPAQGTIFRVPASIPLIAQAQSPDRQIVRVDFVVNGIIIGSAFNAPFTTVWNSAQIGEHQIVARATDSRGAVGVSPIVRIKIEEPPPIAPSISTQPLPKNAEAGGTVRFGVEASGTAPLFYQWAFNERDIASATAPTLVLTNVQPSQSGFYSVKVSNRAGAITSAHARLAVYSASELHSEFWAPDRPVYALAETNGILYLAGAFNYVGPQTGGGAILDLSAGSSLPKQPYLHLNGAIRAVIADGAGGWFAGGVFSAGNLSNLVHVLPGGTLDPEWTCNPDGAVNALALTGGTLYIGGQFTLLNGVPRNQIGAASANSGAVTPWNPDANNPVEAFALGSDRIFVGGQFTRIGGRPRNFAAAVSLNANTDNALPWDPNSGNVVFALAVSGSTVYAGGQFNQIGGRDQSKLAALDASAGLATTWSPRLDQTVRTIAVNGAVVYAGGDFTTVNGERRPYLAALGASSGTLTAWNPDPDSSVRSLAIQDNLIIAGGSFTRIGGQSRQHVAALRRDLDENQATAWAPAAQRTVRAIAATSGAAFVGGEFNSIGGQVRNYLAALNTETGELTEWNPDPNRPVLTMALSGNDLYFGGEFTTVRGVSRQRLAAVDRSTGALQSWNPGADELVNTLLVSGTTVFAGGAFTQIGGRSLPFLAALSTASNQAFAWRPNPDGEIHSLLLDGDLLLAGGSFSRIAEKPRAFLASLASSHLEVLLQDWDAQANRTVLALAAADGSLFAGGLFTHIGGETRNYLAALDPTTALALPEWNPDLSSASSGTRVYTLLPFRDDLLIGGQFNRVGGVPRSHFGIVKRATGVVSALDLSPDLPVRALATAPGGTLYLGGEFSVLAGQPSPFLGAFGPGGAPVFLNHPISQSVKAGIAVRFETVASGRDPLAFQWLRNGAPLDGQTSSSLTLADAQLADEGLYTLVVSNRLGAVSSFPARLDVAAVPSITSVRQKITVDPGTNLVLQATVTGSPPFRFQWRLNGVNIPGANSSTFTITDAQAISSGIYSVAVANAFSATEQEVLDLSVGRDTLAFTDAFGSRPLISSFSGSARGNNLGGTREPREPRHAGKPGGRTSVWAAWQAPASGVATFTTQGSGFDTVLAIYIGTTLETLIEVASDEDQGGFLTSAVTFKAEAGVIYQIAIDGFDGAAGDVVLNWKLAAGDEEVPRILDAPRSLTATNGASVTFSARLAASRVPLTYQWFMNERPIPNATNVSLTLNNVQNSDIGVYSIRASTGTRSVITSPVVLEIGPDAATVSQDKLQDLLAADAPPAAGVGRFGAGQLHGGPPVAVAGLIGTQIFDNYGSTKQPGEPNHCGIVGGRSRWFRLAAEANGTMRVDTEGSAIPTVLAVYTGTTFLNQELVGCDNVSGSVTFPAVRGAVYLIAVDSIDGVEGGVHLNWRLGDLPQILSQPAAQTVAPGGSAIFTVEASGVPEPQFQWQFNGTDLDGQTNRTLTLPTVQPGAAGRYQVIVDNGIGSITSTEAELKVEGIAGLRLLSIGLRENGFRFQILGPAPASIVIQSSSNLFQWAPLQTNLNSPVEFLDPSAGNHPRRFYRIAP